MDALSPVPIEKILWKKALAPYQSPETWRSLWQVANTVLPYILFWGLMFFSLRVSYWLTLLLAIPTAGFMVRTFILFHDCCHGSFFKSARANDTLGFITGVLAFTPYAQWKHDHARHHATAGNLDRRGVGDIVTLTVDEYLAAPWWKKFGYRVARNPLILFTLGAFIVFAFTHRFWRPGAGPRERHSVLWTNLVLASLISGLIVVMGWQAYLMIQIPVLFLAASAGVWLFYVQHQFEGVYWERHDRWDFFKAGLQGSSFYKLPAILQWFSGNIGFHHIHHINPRIPNYKLPQAFRDIPALQIRPLTIGKSLGSIFFHLYDEETRQLVAFSALSRYRTRRIAG